jgi:hypothetical protein
LAANEGLPHFLVRDRAENREFRRTGGGDPKIRDVEHRAQGVGRKRDLDRALEELDERRATASLEELQALGVIVVLEGADAAFPLRLDSLERMSRHRTRPKQPQWLLLSVMPATDSSPERAQVWVSDRYRRQFLKLFEDYVEKTTPEGQPKNRELVANIGRIRAAVLGDLWQSQGAPPTGRRWWEIWLRPDVGAIELLRDYAGRGELSVARHALSLPDRKVAWVRATWSELEPLPFTSVPVAEIREPEFVDTIEDLSPTDQDELAEDLVERIEPAGSGTVPHVCHLDSGVRASHVLLAGSLAADDLHTLFPPSTFDARNHGTLMAGLALYGELDELLLGAGRVRLRHRLESVKILPDEGQPLTDPLAYGVATAHAVSLPESVEARPRVFCMPVTDEPDLPGQPSLWSASVDALAVGAGVAQADDGITVLGGPDPEAARLFVISAGNVDPSDYQPDYRAACDASAIQDPAHSWNALSVGAHTELVGVPSDPDFEGWDALSRAGDISAHSRTSVMFERPWPLKPDICMEGGNILTDGTDFANDHPVVSLRTTDARSDTAIGSANATSAATAQAARLAALAQATYPDYWPETVKGLIVHAAEWTPVMRGEIDAVPGKRERVELLRRYGWGVPSAPAVLASSRQAVTMVAQDTFAPFEGPDFAARRFRLHSLPWPAEQLEEIGDADVTLKVTLSYFVEPTASRRGWRRRYSYASHGLRFELQGPNEPLDDFLRRINRDAAAEEGAGTRSSSGSDRWLIGPNQRNVGALHQDIWEGPGAELALMGTLAVHPVGGWWKNRRSAERVDQPVRYALLVSLKTAEQGVDLYAPIAVQLELPVETTIPST